LESTTGKSIWRDGYCVTNVPKVNALSVVVNAQADAQAYQLDGVVMAHHGDDG